MELGTVVGAGELVAICLSQNSLYILVGRHLQGDYLKENILLGTAETEKN